MAHFFVKNSVFSTQYKPYILLEYSLFPRTVLKRVSPTDFADAITGKIVAGSSAGAYLFSKQYFSSEDQTVHSGLGILQMRLFAHYGSPAFNATDESLKVFERLSDNRLELLTLPECEWISRVVDHLRQ